jgi:hypothetical protein
MTEELSIFVMPTDSGSQRDFAAFTKLLEDRGYRVDRNRWKAIHRGVDVYARPDDDEIQRSLDKAVEADIVSRWERASLVRHYTPDEIATAPLFSFVHVGRHINLPMGPGGVSGVSSIVEISLDRACGQCGCGAHQVGPLHVSGAELNKTSGFASLFIGSNEFVMIDEQVGRAMASITQLVPQRDIALLGRITPKAGWKQLAPDFELPLKACREQRYVRRSCGRCRCVRLDLPPDELATAGYFMVDRAVIERLELPPVMLAPYWDGDVERFDDGRLISVPARRIWFRGDIGRALMAMKIRGLELTPVLAV